MSDYPPRLPGRVSVAGFSANDAIALLLIVGGGALVYFGAGEAKSLGLLLVGFGLGIYSDRAR